MSDVEAASKLLCKSHVPAFDCRAPVMADMTVQCQGNKQAPLITLLLLQQDNFAMDNCSLCLKTDWNVT